MATNQGKEPGSRRSSLIGLSGVFANKFSLWETRTSGEAGALGGADQDAQLPRTTRSGSFGGKMRRLLSPKVSRSHRHQTPFGPDDPSSDIPAGVDADSSHDSGSAHTGSPFARDTEVARSWPVTPASNSKSLWKKLVDKGASGRPGHTPVAAAGSSRYDIPARSPGADSDTHGSDHAMEDEVCADGDSYYSYSPAQGARLMARYSEEEEEDESEGGEEGRHGRMRRMQMQEPPEMEATVDLMNHALGLGTTSQDTPVHGLRSLDSTSLTPGFMEFAHKVGAHITLDEADDFLRPAIDDATVVLVPGADLARAGAYTYDSSPLFIPGAGASSGGAVSRVSPQPGAEAAGGGVNSPPSLAALVQSMLHAEGGAEGSKATAGAGVAAESYDDAEQLPVDASDVQLQLGSERDRARSPSAPPDDFYGIEGQTTELNLRGRWGDDMTATPVPGTCQAQEAMLQLSCSEDEQEGGDGVDADPAAASPAATAGEVEESLEGDAAAADEAVAVMASGDSGAQQQQQEQQQAAIVAEAGAAEEPLAADELPAAKQYEQPADAAEAGALSPLQALAAEDDLPEAAMGQQTPVSSPAREQSPVVTAAEGAFGTPIAIALEPAAGPTPADSTTCAVGSSAGLPASSPADASEDVSAAVAAGNMPVVPEAADEVAIEAPSAEPAAAEPAPMEAASDDAADEGSDDAAASAPASLHAHMISAEASEVDAEGDASETPSTLPSPMTEEPMFSMDVDMPDAPAEEAEAAASAAQSPSAASEAAVPAGVAVEEQEEEGSAHAVPDSPAGQVIAVQSPRPAMPQEPAEAAAATAMTEPAMSQPAEQQVAHAAINVEEDVLAQQQAEQGASLQHVQPQLDSAAAADEAALAVHEDEADVQLEQQHTAEQVQAAPAEEAKQQAVDQSQEADVDAAQLVQHSEQVQEEAAHQADQAVETEVGHEVADAQHQQLSLGEEASQRHSLGDQSVQQQQQQHSLGTEASQEDMALMADATDVPLMLEDSLDAFPGLQSTASPELPGGGHTDTEGDHDDPSSPTFDFQALSNATHATPSPIPAPPPSRRDHLRRSIPLFDAGEGAGLMDESHGSSSTGAAVAGAAASAAARRLSGGARHGGGGHGAVRESIPLFVRPDQQLAGSPGLDDEKLEDLAPFRNYSSHGSAAGGGGGGVRQGATSPRAVGAGFVSSLAPVDEGSLDSPLGSDGSPSFLERNSPLSAPNSGSAARSRALRSSASPDLQIGSPPLLHRLGGGGSSPSKFSPARIAAQAPYGSAAQASSPGGRPSPTKAAAQTRSAFKATAAALAAAAIVPALAPSPIFGAPSPPTLQPLSTQQPHSSSTTPSLLDRTAASPSLVYRANPGSMETPYRQMAALPMQAALAAPLIDNSPFRLGEDAMDTICLADEAQRVLQSLAGGPGMGSGDLGNETMTLLQGHEGMPLDSPVASTGPSPSARLREMHVQMLTRQLTDAEARLHELEVQNEDLRDQLAALEFEKTAAESNGEFEREARLYAEEQLQQAKAEIAQLEGAVGALRRQVTEAGDAAAVAAAARTAERAAWEEERGNLQLRLDEVQVERDSALDTINLNDVRLTALNSNMADLQAALAEEQGQRAMLERALANKEGESREMARSAAEARMQLERAMEQLIAAQTGNEHASRRASDDAARIAALTTQVQTMAADQARSAGDVALLKQKYAQKSAALKEALQKLAFKESESAELMAMCDQLLAQQEAGRGSEDTAGVNDQAP